MASPHCRTCSTLGNLAALAKSFCLGTAGTPIALRNTIHPGLARIEVRLFWLADLECLSKSAENGIGQERWFHGTSRNTHGSGST